ncbi:MAG TPA: hypothetical protein PL007_01150 [Thermomonas sp.]|jgi:cell division protein FtsN|nr:hypothetical protein [Thermomonas sp.]
MLIALVATVAGVYELANKQKQASPALVSKAVSAPQGPHQDDTAAARIQALERELQEARTQTAEARQAKQNAQEGKCIGGVWFTRINVGSC